MSTQDKQEPNIEQPCEQCGNFHDAPPAAAPMSECPHFVSHIVNGKSICNSCGVPLSEPQPPAAAPSANRWRHLTDADLTRVSRELAALSNDELVAESLGGYCGCQDCGTLSDELAEFRFDAATTELQRRLIAMGFCTEKVKEL